MRKALYILYIPLLIIEWAVDLIKKLWTVIHEGLVEMTLVIETKINEPAKSIPDN